MPQSVSNGGMKGMIAAGLFWLALQVAPEPLQVRFHHEGRCEDPCRDEGHWKAPALDALQKEADAHREGAPRPELSERIVFFGGDRGVPFSVVMGAMRRCIRVGIYKMAWVDDKGEMGTKFWLKDPEGPSLVCKREDIQVVLKWDPKRREHIRRIGARPSVGSIAELRPTIRQMIADFKKVGRSLDYPVFIDAEDDLTWNGVSWREVVEVMDLCRAEGLDKFEFLPLLRRKAAEKK
jgi:hypothetical protein